MKINLMIDPEASKIALTADFPNITIAGNVANQVFPTKEFMEEVRSVPNPYSELFYKYYDLSFPFWDETAAALMVDPSLSVNQTSGVLIRTSSICDVGGLTDFKYFWTSTSHMAAPAMETSMCTKRHSRHKASARSTMCLRWMPRSSRTGSSMLCSTPNRVLISSKIDG